MYIWQPGVVVPCVETMTQDFLSRRLPWRSRHSTRKSYMATVWLEWNRWTTPVFRDKVKKVTQREWLNYLGTGSMETGQFLTYTFYEVSSCLSQAFCLFAFLHLVSMDFCTCNQTTAKTVFYTHTKLPNKLCHQDVYWFQKHWLGAGHVAAFLSVIPALGRQRQKNCTWI